MDPKKVILKRVVSTNIGVFVSIYYRNMVSFSQEKKYYTSCSACGSLHMHTEYVCIYRLDMADYFLLFIFTDVLMIYQQRTGLVLISSISSILYYVYLYVYFAVWIL
jgi:hypothetical protein